jgi:hypothetical protein
MRRHRPWIPAVVLALAACVVNPQPEPALRPVDQTRVALSAPGLDSQATVAGERGATPGAGEVEVVHLRLGETHTYPASAEGSFSARLEALAGDQLLITFRAGGLTSTPIEVEVPRGGSEPIDPPAIVTPLPPPSSFGLVRITGDVVTGATPLRVVAADLDQPSTNSVEASADGSFALDLVAAAGDLVSIFAFDTTAPARASEPVTTNVSVPAAENCLNSFDDDGDGFVDCDDPDCTDFCRCPDTLTFCGGTCTDTRSDANNCNECGNVCPRDTPTCDRGVCI